MKIIEIVKKHKLKIAGFLFCGVLAGALLFG